jgi:hypothetical protein
MRFLIPLAAVAALFSACGAKTNDATRIAPLRFGYPQDDVLRVNDIQMKGTHNSYHEIKSPDNIAEWLYFHDPLDVQLEREGVRQFELDVHYVAETGRFAVYHIPGADNASTCPLFADCLATLKAWSDAHRGHHPIVVLIEPKDEADAVRDKIAGHYDALDAEVLAVIGRGRLITPDDIQGRAPTLRDAVTTTGWPTLGESRGKFIFVLLDSDHGPDGHLYGYTRGLKDLHGRVMFVDAPEEDPFAGFMLLDGALSDKAQIEAMAKKGYLIRTMVDDKIVAGVPESRARMAAGLAGFANTLSTDYPVERDSAPGYFLDLTGGTPSRCHPLAPKSCTSEDIESPARLQPLN